ncbi:condensation domain-containing protein, partial [Gordonia sp. NPDC003425]
ALGGNSLSAMRVAARVADVFGVQVSVRDLFDAPTVDELAELVGRRDAGLAPIRAVEPRPARIPLSFAQSRMWFINRFEPGTATYNIPALLRLRGPLDIDALRHAMVDVVARHEILRTTFPAVDGAPVQVIHPAHRVTTDLDFAVVDDEDALREAVSTGFDVTEQWPLRVRVLAMNADEHLVAVVAHHIAADGESMRPLVADLVTAYLARAGGRSPDFVPLTVQFADYAIWQHETLGDPADPASVVGAQLDHWRTTLAGLPDVLDIPADRPRPTVASHRGARLEVTIPAEVAGRITATAAAHGVTPFMVVHAALAVLLARLSGGNDIAIATPVAGRGQAVLDPLVGMFVNTLVLRTGIEPAEPFSDLLDRVRVTDLEAFTHADVPFETIVDALDPVRSEAFAPLAQVMLSLDSGATADDAVRVDTLEVESVAPPVVPAQLDLAVTVATEPAGEDWRCSIVYATDLFDESRVATFAERYRALLGGLTAVPGDAVGDVVMITRAEADAAVAAATGPIVDPITTTVADAVAAQVVRSPGAPALWFEGRVVSYAEFGARVAVLARELIAVGVGPEVAVGVSLERSVEFVVAIHAVVAAGGQYVPIDPSAPAERAAYMLDTAGVEVIVVRRDERPGWLAGVGARHIVEVDASGSVDESAAPVADGERLSVLRPDAALYTLFTSGSTGRPKGVTVSHRSAANRLWWAIDRFALTDADRVVLKTPVTFDVSVPELFAPLMSGAQVVVARAGGHADPGYLAELIGQTRATSVHFVPSMLSVFLDVVPAERIRALDSLRWLLTSGEALPASVARRAHELLGDTRIHNLYGPTEAAVDVTDTDVTDAEHITIGAPVWNTTAYVLDARLGVVPPGVPGELYLGGVQVARGYASR